MKQKEIAGRRMVKAIVVAPAGAYTWVVDSSRRLIPGACFTTRAAALRYASLLAKAVGLGGAYIRVLDA